MKGVEYLRVGNITIPSSRQRTDVPEKYIKELAKSIKANGLFHSLTVSLDDTLIAGFCRLSALKTIDTSFYYAGEEVPPGLIPVTYTHKEEKRELFQIELEENLRRKNLNHLEEASAIAQLHEYFSSLGSPKAKLDTAEALIEYGRQQVLSTSRGVVADALLLSEFKNEPAVKAARTKRAAVRVAKRIAEQNVMSALGATTKLASSSHTICLGNSHEELQELSSGTYDGIITDPPYGIDAQNFGESSFLGQGHAYQDTKDDGLRALSCLATEGIRICKPQAHMYVFCDIGRFNEYCEILTRAGWSVWKTPLIWHKGATAHAPKPDHGPKRSYEAIIFASKGNKRIQYCGLDVIIQSGVYRDDKLHPAEKPWEVYSELIKWSFMAGDLILDPFCGVGTVFLAATKAKVIAHGIELDETYFNIARTRMEKGDSDG